MRIVLFYHSLISDWNHRNAHFLRGIATEFQKRADHVRVYEPAGGWSFQNLSREYGRDAVAEFAQRFPSLRTNFYKPDELDLDKALDHADLVIVHEWTDNKLVRRI